MPRDPGEVIAVSERDGLPFGEVRFGDVTREVCLTCHPDVVPGDFVLVHVGLAIAKIDRAEADARLAGAAGARPDRRGRADAAEGTDAPRMKYLDEYRDPAGGGGAARARSAASRPARG